MLREELTETLAQVDTVRRRLAEVEHTLEKVRESAARTQHELQDRLAQEKHKKCIIEDDYRIQTQVGIFLKTCFMRSMVFEQIAEGTHSTPSKAVLVPLDACPLPSAQLSCKKIFITDDDTFSPPT